MGFLGELFDDVLSLPARIVEETLSLPAHIVEAARKAGCTTEEQIRKFADEHME